MILFIVIMFYYWKMKTRITALFCVHNTRTMYNCIKSDWPVRNIVPFSYFLTHRCLFRVSSDTDWVPWSSNINSWWCRWPMLMKSMNLCPDRDLNIVAFPSITCCFMTKNPESAKFSRLMKSRTLKTFRTLFNHLLIFSRALIWAIQQGLRLPRSRQYSGGRDWASSHTPQCPMGRWALLSCFPF